MRAMMAAAVFLVGLVTPMSAQTAKNPKELGSVRWHRDLDAGLARAAAANKPVFLQFQEVPG